MSGGYIECGYEDRFCEYCGTDQCRRTRIHAFVCTVFDEIISGSQIPLEVNDPTGYYTDRNFENLKYKYFYRWLKDIQGYVLDHIDEEKGIMHLLAAGVLSPVYREGFVVTPLGYIHRDDFSDKGCRGLGR